MVYFPREDIAMAMLDPSETTTTCPHKGTARYFDIVNRSATLKDAVWSYEDPHDPVAAIKDLFAGVTGDRVTVEQI